MLIDLCSWLLLINWSLIDQSEKASIDPEDHQRLPETWHAVDNCWWEEAARKKGGGKGRWPRLSWLRWCNLCCIVVWKMTLNIHNFIFYYIFMSGGEGRDYILLFLLHRAVICMQNFRTIGQITTGERRLKKEKNADNSYHYGLPAMHEGSAHT